MRSHHLLLIAVIALFAAQVVRSAWLCDDAFISLRTVDHFVEGRGLVWNLGERVQVFTHPLWMFLVSGIYAVRPDPTFALHAASVLGTLVFLLVLARAHGRAESATGWGLLAALVVAATSKAFVEYSSSGLENPLTHLLLACAYWIHLRDGPASERLGRLSFAVALVALNRLDAVLLVAPPLMLDAWRALRATGAWPTLRALLLGLSPLIAWELFSLFYFGFPFPNTAYAKLETGLSRGWHVSQGLHFFAISARVDPVTVVGLSAGLALALRARLWTLAAALLLHPVYVLWVGGDFMVGRFLTPPLTLALIAIARNPSLSPRGAGLTASAFAVLGMVSANAPLRLWFQSPETIAFGHGVTDERASYSPYTGVFRSEHPEGPAETPGALEAQSVSALLDPDDPRSRFAAWETVGFYGYYADPRLHILDPFALAEPLLARLPVEDPASVRIGHFRRAAPAGFMPSVVSGENHIEDPDLARFAGPLRTVISGPLWSFERLGAIWSVNFGDGKRGLRTYVTRELAARDLRE